MENIIKVVIGNNAGREPVMMSDTTTLREALENRRIDYTRGLMSLDGSPLQPGDLDKTFKDFGITKSCYLLNIVKTDNAIDIVTARMRALKNGTLRLKIRA